MSSSEFRSCPGCGRKSEPTTNKTSRNFVVECSKCGFSATTLDVVRADYLANFVPLPDIRIAATRIANRSMLKYWAVRQAS
ncbi:MAG: hypothetical protein HQ477_11955 [Chloroflexi bacterium]|nr:hypothetical protein [Chloroflexota bacterium]